MIDNFKNMIKKLSYFEALNINNDTLSTISILRCISPNGIFLHRSSTLKYVIKRNAS